MLTTETKANKQLSGPITINRIYVKELSFKIPYAPSVFEESNFKNVLEQAKPAMEMNVKTQKLADDRYEVALHLIVQCRADNFSILTLEVQQAGIFTIDSSLNPETILTNDCVKTLHPYLSQTVANASMQAGFPPIVLQPLGSTEHSLGLKPTTKELKSETPGH
jgi:preprotein translocase subunit SecB